MVGRGAGGWVIGIEVGGGWMELRGLELEEVGETCTKRFSKVM